MLDDQYKSCALDAMRDEGIPPEGYVCLRVTPHMQSLPHAASTLFCDITTCFAEAWHVQGTFLPAAKAADLGSMGRHAELLDAARDIRQGIADLKSRNETPEGLTHRRSLERRQSISQAERHMFDFDRIMRVRLPATPMSCLWPHATIWPFWCSE